MPGRPALLILPAVTPPGASFPCRGQPTDAAGHAQIELWAEAVLPVLHDAAEGALDADALIGRLEGHGGAAARGLLHRTGAAAVLDPRHPTRGPAPPCSTDDGGPRLVPGPIPGPPGLVLADLAALDGHIAGGVDPDLARTLHRNIPCLPGRWCRPSSSGTWRRRRSGVMLSPAFTTTFCRRRC